MDEKELEALLGKGMQSEIQVTKALGNMEIPFTAIVIIDSKEYTQMRNAIMKKYSKEGKDIIYITFSKGFEKLLDDLKKENIRNEKIQFIDMVSLDRGIEEEENKNVEFMESPNGLTDCMIKIEKKLGAAKEHTLVMLDSISSMMVYNETSAIEKFSHTLVGKVNAKKSSLIMLSSDSESSHSVIATIGNFVDKTITV